MTAAALVNLRRKRDELLQLFLDDKITEELIEAVTIYNDQIGSTSPSPGHLRC